MQSRTRVTTVATLLLVLAAPSLSTAQEAATDFSVEPARGSSLAEGASYFSLNGEAGDSFRQALVVGNGSNDALTLRLAAVDAGTGPFGGAAYGLPAEDEEKVGSWIEFERRSLRLQPRESARIAFTVRVPADASSGVHLGGVTVWSPVDGDVGGAAQGQAGASVVLQTRRVIAVMVKLPGPDDAELVVHGIEPEARPDGIYLGIQIENAGQGITKGSGTVELPDEGFIKDFDIDTFVPGTRIAYPIRWKNDARDGEYPARVEIDYEVGPSSRTVEWQGTFTLGEAILEDLEQRGGGTGGGAPLWLWPTIAGVALAFLAAAWLLLRRRRVQAAPRLTPARHVDQRAVLPAPTDVRRRMPPPPPPPPAP